MSRLAGSALLACALSAGAVAERLTLDEALATAAADHPDRRLAESELAVARADRDEAANRQNFNLYLDGALRTGLRPSDVGPYSGEWRADNVGRIVARMPLLDFGRSGESITAANQSIASRQAELFNVDSLRRLDIMARYFDVLLADMQYAADNEFMAVAYVSWDDAKDRFELGQITQPELLKLEAAYQDIRERSNASMQRMRATRQKLAHAMHRPNPLPTELLEPLLPANARQAPTYDTLLPWVMEKNPRLQALQAQVVALDARLAAIRSEDNPILEAEVIGAGYSRESTTRDDVSAGIVFLIPLYHGGRVDARIARELAQRERSSADQSAYQSAEVNGPALRNRQPPPVVGPAAGRLTWMRSGKQSIRPRNPNLPAMPRQEVLAAARSGPDFGFFPLALYIDNIQKRWALSMAATRASC